VIKTQILSRNMVSSKLQLKMCGLLFLMVFLTLLIQFELNLVNDISVVAIKNCFSLIYFRQVVHIMEIGPGKKCYMKVINT
jgi:hypothetical protein